MSKLRLTEPCVAVSISQARVFGCDVMTAAGWAPSLAGSIVDHLLDAELCGVEPHGIMRVLQYAEEVKNGYLQAHAVP